ncbi:MAG: hypothetical protein AB7V48_09380 [Sedimentibacter sp.]
MSNTPENKITDKLSEVKMKRDGQFQFTNINGRIEPDLNILSKKENEKMVEKKIVNNKPSQFRPILGVNFHMIKK